KQGGKQSVACLEGSPPVEGSGNGLAIISKRVVMVIALDGEPWGSHSVVKLQVRSKVRRGGLDATVARSLEVNYVAINRHSVDLRLVIIGIIVPFPTSAEGVAGIITRGIIQLLARRTQKIEHVAFPKSRIEQCGIPATPKDERVTAFDVA